MGAQHGANWINTVSLLPAISACNIILRPYDIFVVLADFGGIEK